MKNFNSTQKHDPLLEVVRLLFIISQQLQGISGNAKPYYDNADMKQIFNISSSTLYRLRKQKLIPFKNIGNKIYYPVEQINSFFQDNTP